MIDGTTSVRYRVEKAPGYKYTVTMATFDKDGRVTNPEETVGGPLTAWELMEWYDTAKQAWKECHDIDDVVMVL